MQLLWGIEPPEIVVHADPGVLSHLEAMRSLGASGEAGSFGRAGRRRMGFEPDVRTDQPAARIEPYPDLPALLGYEVGSTLSRHDLHGCMEPQSGLEGGAQATPFAPSSGLENLRLIRRQHRRERFRLL